MSGDKMTDIAEAGAIVDIPNLGKRLRAPDDMRYRYPAEKCPSCGGVGIPWRGWFNCDGPADCGAKAWIATGEVFLPVPPDDDEAEAAWKAEYLAAFARISVERKYWTAEDAAPWAESCVADAWACAGNCPPAEVAAEDVEVCAREGE